MKSIAVIGCGFVGGSLARVFLEKSTRVHVFDRTKDLAFDRLYDDGPNCIVKDVKDVTYRSMSELVERVEGQDDQFSGIYFICVPTPMRQSGAADLSIVEAVLRKLSEMPRKDGQERIAVVKSTVPPGSTQRWNDMYAERLRVIFCPEFLTEANALEDMRNQDRIVLGGPRPWINQVKLMFQRAFPKVPIIKTSSTTAEMVKYFTNVSLMVKVCLANEIAQVCEALDDKGLNIDYDKVVEYATKDKRLGTSHWQVPGPDGCRGGGGHCFPKDLNALIHLSNELGVLPTIMQAAWDKNLEVRPPEERDWERMAGRAVSSETEEK